MSQPVDKQTVVYIIFCLLMDASSIAFRMNWLGVSTFCKSLARRTDERWDGDWAGGAELGETPDPEIEKQKQLLHSQAVLDSMAAHGCLTGDCPHRRQSECDKALADAYKEYFNR